MARLGADEVAPGLRRGRRDSEPGIPRTVASWFRVHRAEVISAGSAYLALVSVLPILTTPYRSDDKISAEIPNEITGSGLAAVRSALGVAHTMFAPWMADRGRFFPGSALWTVSVFTAFPSRLSYKVFLAGLVLIMVLLTALMLRTLVGRASAHVVVVTLAASLTLRNWFDGLDTFTGVLPFTICLTLATGLLLLKGRSWPSAVTAALLWTYALTSYEVAILLAPTLVILVITRRRWQRTLPVLLSTLGILALVAVLRSRALNPPGDAYTLNLDPSAVLATYLRQTLSALPLAEQWYPGAAPLTVDLPVIALMIGLVGIPAAVVLSALSHGTRPESWPRLGVATLLGLSCWLLPPLLIAVSLGWQRELPPGEGYVSVVWGYVGVSILMAVGWIVLARRAATRPTGLRRFALHSSTAVISVLCALTVAQSATIASLVQTQSM